MRSLDEVIAAYRPPGSFSRTDEAEPTQPSSTRPPNFARSPFAAQPPQLAGMRRRLQGILAPRTIDLTGGQIRVAAVGAQDLRTALDALPYDTLDLELRVLLLQGSASPDVTIELQTGMSNTDPFGWVTLGTFALVSASDTVELKHFENLLRYVRWNVTQLRGTNPAAVFQIRGVGRRWA